MLFFLLNGVFGKNAIIGILFLSALSTNFGIKSTEYLNISGILLILIFLFFPSLKISVKSNH